MRKITGSCNPITGSTISEVTIAKVGEATPLPRLYNANAEAGICRITGIPDICTNLIHVSVMLFLCLLDPLSGPARIFDSSVCVLRSRPCKVHDSRENMI